MATKMNKYDRTHLSNLSKYQRQIDTLYRRLIQEASQLGAAVDGLTGEELFAFDNFPTLKKRAERLLNEMHSGMSAVIVNGVNAEWTLANNKNSELARTVFGDNVGKLTQAQYRKYFSANDKAREAFLARKEAGLNLSDRVWRYTNQFKGEIELGLDVGIRNGMSAAEMARGLKAWLREPDKLFRRVRDEHGDLQPSRAMAAYHPGQGVYRSSYKNARRLAATETNIAYRTADYERWQELPFVVGIEVVLSNNHPEHDICDELKGRYPKDFKFTGWHPHCRCHAVSVLKTEEEIEEDTRRILNGEDPTTGSTQAVRKVPQAFKDWLADNDERLQKATSLPYFITDNSKYTGVLPHYRAVGAVTGTKLGRAAARETFEAYENLPAPTFSEEVTQNTKEIAEAIGIKEPITPMTFMEANSGKGNLSFREGDEFTENCQMTAPIHEARLRGLNVTALGYDKSKDSVPYMLGEHWERIWINPKTGKTPELTNLKGDNFDKLIGKVNEATKSKGRYHIGINMPHNSGHIVTAERLDSGKLVFYDPQNGVPFRLEEYAERSVESFEVLKVDKLLLRKDLFTKIARVL